MDKGAARGVGLPEIEAGVNYASIVAHGIMDNEFAGGTVNQWVQGVAGTTKALSS